MTIFSFTARFFAPNTSRRTLLAAAMALGISGCATSPAPTTVADALANNPALSTFNGLVVQAGLNTTLRTEGPFTVFAPTNDAFKAISASTLDDMGKHPEKLKAMLSYHILTSQTRAADVKNSNVKTLNGASVALSKAGDFVTIENAAVVTADLMARNGVVHTIDAVLQAPKK